MCVPVDCDVGFYRASPDSSECIPCPHGFTTASAGPNVGIGVCIPIDCDVGYYRPDARSECEECPDGTTTESGGQNVGIQMCKSGCPPGTEKSPGGACVECREGTYGRGGLERCTPCPPGLTTVQIGAASKRLCVRFPVSPVQGGVGLCPVGLYSKGATGGCVSCPPDMTTLRVGAERVQECVCLAGFEPRLEIYHHCCCRCHHDETLLIALPRTALDCLASWCLFLDRMSLSCSLGFRV